MTSASASRVPGDCAPVESAIEGRQRHWGVSVRDFLFARYFRAQKKYAWIRHLRPEKQKYLRHVTVEGSTEVFLQLSNNEAFVTM